MLLSFFEGILAAFGALILELSPTIFGSTFSETSLFFILFTASIEEAVKYTFIYNHYLKLASKEKILSGAFFIGLGFAITEIILKRLSYEKNTIIPIAGIFLVHLLTAVLLGLFFRKKNQKPLFLSFIIVLLNIFLHFFYNLLILRYL
jgi:RsiW-degrading membrane proteinase PrsW (M82 family)